MENKPIGNVDKVVLILRHTDNSLLKHTFMSVEGAFDSQFKTIKPDWCGIIIWRVENFELVRWNDIGAFFTGDSYLIYHAYIQGTSRRVNQHIYFWLGSESSTDEKGTAALKAVNLDDYFGGAPIQHREVQYHESEAFRVLFEKNGGIRYMAGGIDSGFKQVTKENRVVLYHVKGRKNPVLQQVPPVGTSLNQGDVFILHASSRFFIWFGKRANRMEKMKGVNFLDGLRSKDPKSQVVRLEDGETNQDFWDLLGGETEIASAEQGGDDDQHEVNMVKQICKIEDGKTVVIAEGPACKPTILSSSDRMYIIRSGRFVLVWSGKSVPKEEQSKAIQYGVAYLESNGLPDWTPVSTLVEGVDSPDFALAFA